MIIAALVLGSLALLVSLVTAAALIEVYEAYKNLGLDDEPLPLEIPDAIGTHPSLYGLPSDLDDQSAVILFLSPTCSACHEVAKALGHSIPEQLHVVVTETATEAAQEWLSGFGIPMDRCTIDGERLVAQRLGLNGTPVALVVDEGRLSQAITVPSVKWLGSFLQEVGA